MISGFARLAGAAFLLAATAIELSGCASAIRKANEFMLTTVRIKADNESDFQKARSEPFTQAVTGVEYDNVVGQTYLSGICSAYHKDPQKALSSYIGKEILVKGIYQKVNGQHFLLFDAVMDDSSAPIPTPVYNMVYFNEPTNASTLYLLGRWSPGEIHSAYGAIDGIVPLAKNTGRCSIHLAYAFTKDDLSALINSKRHEGEGK